MCLRRVAELLRLCLFWQRYRLAPKPGVIAPQAMEHIDVLSRLLLSELPTREDPSHPKLTLTLTTKPLNDSIAGAVSRLQVAGEDHCF